MTTQTPSIREALELALDLSKYAAAPFFGDKERHHDPAGDVYYTYRTTEEWWEGLKELIEAIQPKLEAALSVHPEPQEPNAEMIQQGVWAWSREPQNDTIAGTVRRVYLAMRRMEDRSER